MRCGIKQLAQTASIVEVFRHLISQVTEDGIDATVQSLRERVFAPEAENRALRDAVEALPEASGWHL